MDDKARRDWGLILVLLLVAAGIRTWLLTHTVVAARDSIGYIRYAWQLDHKSWQTVLKDSFQHPGYPITVLLVSKPVRAFYHGTDAEVWQLSAQLASAIAGVLLVLPMFFLGRELFDRRVGFWAALLFQCFPVSGRILSDGLSEGVFLLLIATALLLAVRALRRDSLLEFGICGLCSGLAYLTRPEGALPVVALTMVLAMRQFTPALRRQWAQVLGEVVTLGGVALVVALPFMITIEGVSTKPTTLELMPTVPLSAHPVPASILLAVWSLDADKGSLTWGLLAVLQEVMKGFFYCGWIVALLGLWWDRNALRVAPGRWLLLVLGTVHGLVLWRLAAKMGYVSERHALVVVLCGMYWTAAGLLTLGEMLGRIRPCPAGTVACLLAAASLVPTLKPLHTNRAGHRAAGDWLVRHAHPADEIKDPFCWAHYLAGRVFQEGQTPPVSPEGQRTWVVLEGGGESSAKSRKPFARLLPGFSLDRADNHDHAREPQMNAALALARQGYLAYHWPEQAPLDKARILIYAVDPPASFP